VHEAVIVLDTGKATISLPTLTCEVGAIIGVSEVVVRVEVSGVTVALCVIFAELVDPANWLLLLLALAVAASITAVGGDESRLIVVVTDVVTTVCTSVVEGPIDVSSVVSVVDVAMAQPGVPC
jgi:hypothetical protein